MARLEKVIAVGLQAAAALLLYLAGLARGDIASALVVGIPGIASAVAGLLLWGRAARPLGNPTPTQTGDTTAREAPAFLQRDVAELREDREFFRQLYAQKLEIEQTLKR